MSFNLTLLFVVKEQKIDLFSFLIIFAGWRNNISITALRLSPELVERCQIVHDYLFLILVDMGINYQSRKYAVSLSSIQKE
jgi:hypothetical protein